MTPISHTRTGDKVVWHYKFSDLRQFILGCGLPHPNMNCVLIERNASGFVYKIRFSLEDGGYVLKSLIERRPDKDLADDFYTKEPENIFVDYGYVMPSQGKAIVTEKNGLAYFQWQRMFWGR